MTSDSASWSLDTDRLVISRLLPTDEHADFIVALYNTPEFIAGEGDTGIDTTEKALKFIQRMDERFEKHGHGVYLLSLKSDLQPVGTVSLMRADDYAAPDIGFALLSEYMGQGYATESAKRMMRYAVEDLKYPGVFGFCAASNTKSRQALGKLDLVYKGEYPLAAFGGGRSAVFADKSMGDDLTKYGIKEEKLA